MAQAAPLLIWSTAGTDTGIGTAAEALDLIATGIIDPDGLAFRAEPDNGRSFLIRFKTDRRPEARGMDWRLLISGRGHWCEGSNGMGGPGLGGIFRTVGEAVEAGTEWIVTGRDASARVHGSVAAAAVAEAA